MTTAHTINALRVMSQRIELSRQNWMFDELLFVAKVEAYRHMVQAYPSLSYVEPDHLATYLLLVAEALET